MKTLALLNAGQLLTLAGLASPRGGTQMLDIGLIEHGGMLVRDGVITTVGLSSEIEREISTAVEVIDAQGRVVLPGFVDAHAHPVFAGNRVDEFELRARGKTYEEIAAAGGGIQSTVAKTRAATEAQLFEQARRHVGWFLRGGTTTLEAKSGYGLSVEDELKILRVIRALNEETPLELVPTFLGAHAVPKGTTPDKYIGLVVDEMLPRVAEEKFAEFCDVFCEQNYFSIEASRKILLAARARGLHLRMHADQLTNSGAVALAAELGTITADHLEQTDATGIAALKAAGVQPVLLPASVYSLGHKKYPRAREMIDAGLAVVLATDFNPGSSPTPSMPMILSLALTHLKMTVAEAITAATINAAYSLRRGGSIGSLEVGKRANFSIFDCRDYREIGYYFGAMEAYSVFIGGARVI